jgi:hypothetical protein
MQLCSDVTMGSTKQAEHRHSYRLVIDVPLEWGARDSALTVHGLARDISLGGMFIETERPALPGSLVVVGLARHGYGVPVVLSATVRWFDRRGMGIQFGPLRTGPFPTRWS